MTCWGARFCLNTTWTCFSPKGLRDYENSHVRFWHSVFDLVRVTPHHTGVPDTPDCHILNSEGVNSLLTSSPHNSPSVDRNHICKVYHTHTRLRAGHVFCRNFNPQRPTWSPQTHQEKSMCPWKERGNGLFYAWKPAGAGKESKREHTPSDSKSGTVRTKGIHAFAQSLLTSWLLEGSWVSEG